MYNYHFLSCTFIFLKGLMFVQRFLIVKPWLEITYHINVTSQVALLSVFAFVSINVKLCVTCSLRTAFDVFRTLDILEQWAFWTIQNYYLNIVMVHNVICVVFIEINILENSLWNIVNTFPINTINYSYLTSLKEKID